MLVLSRKKDEAIIVGTGENQIRIIVVGIKGNNVRIGVEANTDIPVHRQEVYDKIHNKPEE